MSWRDLIEPPTELSFPWVGGREIRQGTRTWRLEGDTPPEHGWYTFQGRGRKATLLRPAEPGALTWHTDKGYLVGDLIIHDGVGGGWRDFRKFPRYAKRVHLLDAGLGRFQRVVVGAAFEYGPLIYDTPDFPLGPEDEVQVAFEDRAENLDGIKGVTPALETAWRFECWKREQVEIRRAELERLRREEEERVAREAQRAALVRQLGDGAGRRQMAEVDFEAAARAALAVGEAELLDVQEMGTDMVVRYRYRGRRLECVCDRSLHIIDAGICLTDHRTEEKGDTLFTLESLPGVVGQAIDEGVLHIWRHG